MANDFVWAGAGGDNSGDSWLNARPSLMIDWGAEAGFTEATDIVYVRDSHVESTAGTLTMTGSAGEGTIAPVRAICVVGNDTGTTPGNLSTGASVTASGTNDIIIDEKVYIYGVNFFAGNDLFVGSASVDHDITMEVCRLELTGTSGGDNIYFSGAFGSVGARITMIDCTFDFNEDAQGFSVR